MAQETPDQTPFLADDPASSPSAADSAEPSLTRSSSGARLNARAPEYVPKTSPHGPTRGGGQHQPHHHQQHQQQQQHHHRPYYQQHQPKPPRLMQIHHHAPPPPPPPPPVMHVYQPVHGAAFHVGPQLVPGHGPFEYYGGGGLSEHEDAHNGADPDSMLGACDADAHIAPPVEDGVSEEVAYKVTKQVEYYFSDANLATTEHLMRFISKDPEGYVPISVIASFKKIRALINNNGQLAAALQTSLKLVVSEDGKKVKRQKPITDADLEELQSRIVIAENLPEDHCYQNLVKVFSVVGNVKTIRTCYPQAGNGSTPVNSRGKVDMFLFNKLHAFVEYETVEQAEKAVGELNDGGNWRSGLRVRLLPVFMRHGPSRGRKGGHEADGNTEEEGTSPPKQQNEKDEDHCQQTDFSLEDIGEQGHHDRDGGVRRGRGRGRGGRGRGRGPYHTNNRGVGHPVVTPLLSNQVHTEPHAVTKQPPGPRMPDGTRGFTVGRGKPLDPTDTAT